jgi:hypothetical protein
VVEIMIAKVTFHLQACHCGVEMHKSLRVQNGSARPLIEGQGEPDTSNVFGRSWTVRRVSKAKSVTERAEAGATCRV